MYRRELIQKLQDYKKSRWGRFARESTNLHKERVADNTINAITAHFMGENGSTIILKPEELIVNLSNSMIEDAEFEKNCKSRLMNHLNELRDKIIQRFAEKEDLKTIKKILDQLNIFKNNYRVDHPYLFLITNCIKQLDNLIKDLPKYIFEQGMREFEDKKNYEKARKRFEKSLEFLDLEEKPDAELKFTALNSLGVSMYAIGLRVSNDKGIVPEVLDLFCLAKEKFQLALEVSQNNPKAVSNLASVNEAIEVFNKTNRQPDPPKLM